MVSKDKEKGNETKYYHTADAHIKFFPFFQFA